MDKQKIIFAIPARLESKRLPKKILLDIGGEPMIKRVIDRVKKANKNFPLFICTDSNEVNNLCGKWGYEVIKTSKNCSSGTARIASVIDLLISKSWDLNFSNLNQKERNNILVNTFVINIQADQPFISKSLLDECINTIRNNPENKIITPVYPLEKNSIHNPNIVKVLFNKEKKAIYFSRAAIPFVRDVPIEDWSNHCKYWGHLGIYCYRGDFLNNFSLIPNSDLEDIEKLEQLRFIDAGYKVHIFITRKDTISIDEISQLNKAREMIKMNLIE